MSLSAAIAKNTIFHTLGKFSGSLIGLVIIGFLTRYLGAVGYGYYTTVFAYLFFFSTLGDLGLYLVTLNELGKAGADKIKIYSNIFTMRLVSGILFMAVASILIWFFPYPLIVKLGTLVAALSVLFMMVDQITVTVFQEQMQTKFVAIAEIVGKLLTLILTLTLIHLQAGFMYVLWAVVLGFLVHFFINIFFARRLLKFSLAFDFEFWQTVFKKSWPIATFMIFSMLYFKADTIILSLYHSARVVGLYGAPYKILEVLIAFPAIFLGLVSPHLARAWSTKNLIDFERIFQKAFDFLSLIVWPLIFGTSVLAKPIINFIAGAQFVESAKILPLLILATGIIFIAHLSTFTVVTLNKQKQMMKYYLVAAISALALYFIFIPPYSYWAAAAVTVLIEFFILATSWLMVKKETHMHINFINNLKALLASLIMAAAIWLANFSLLPSVLLGILVYAGSSYVLGVWNKDTLKALMK